MARLTKEEQAELERLQAAAAADDDDDEVTISHGDLSFKGSMRRAREVAAAWGMKLKADPPDDDDDKKDAGQVKRFNAGRRTG